MKVRIQGNSIRLRLTQTEVINFGKEGICNSEIQFPNGNSLTCHLGLATKMGADFSNDTINIYLPKTEVRKWVNTDQVGIQGNLTIEDQNNLRILVEKDFKCLTERQEDESDMFPNPNEVHA